MKKVTFIFALLIMSVTMFSQEKPVSETKEQTTAKKDSITEADIIKSRYIISVIVNGYAQSCYNDSIPITEFIGKPLGGQWWKNVGQYYWDIYTPLPNVKYLHRKMDVGILLEEFSTKLGNK